MEQPPRPAPTQIDGQDRVPCSSCGFDLRGIVVGGVCPECGTPIVQVGNPAQSSGKAIASMVLGIVSVLGCLFYGLPGIVCGILALVYHRKAMVAIQLGDAPINSVGMARSGRICGIIGLVLGVLYVVGIGIYILFIIGIFASGGLP